MTSEIAIWLVALAATLALAVLAWGIATRERNVGLVDVFWSLFVLAGAIVHAVAAPVLSSRAALALALAVVWSLRLAAYLAARNWGADEDRRYRVIRERNSPGFAWKSLYLVFGLQAVLAWIVSAPLGAAIGSSAPLGPLDVLGATLALFGIAYETIADAQLAQFKSRPANAGEVMNRGLWRYSRHPNYFGEFCVWWGLYAIAVGAGAWWTLLSPLLMSVLLLKVSGVTLLEKDMGERRPAYRGYAASTNAFFPGPPRDA